MLSHLVKTQNRGGYNSWCGNIYYDPDHETVASDIAHATCLTCIKSIRRVAVSPEIVKELRLKYRNGVRGNGLRALAKKYGLTNMAVYRAIHQPVLTES